MRGEEMRLGTVALVLVAALAVAGCSNDAGQKLNPTVISGKVTCMSGLPVAGVWIVAESGEQDSNFAAWSVDDPAKPSVAKFSYTLPYGGKWAPHVGCGQQQQDPRQWIYDDHASFVDGTTRDFECYDPAEGIPFGLCNVVVYTSASVDYRGGGALLNSQIKKPTARVGFLIWWARRESLFCSSSRRAAPDSAKLGFHTLPRAGYDYVRFSKQD